MLKADAETGPLHGGHAYVRTCVGTSTPAIMSSVEDRGCALAASRGG